jgi:putative transcriptional regulator
MLTRPITVAETHGFMRAAQKIWSEEELAALVDHLARNPEDGDIIPGTGGVRKLRWGKAGSGKRGGARVIYLLPDGLPALSASRLCQGTDNRPDGGREARGGRLCRHHQGGDRQVKERVMERTFGQDLIAAMEEAAAHAQGTGEVARAHVVQVPDVRAIREQLGLSQTAFAQAYRIPLATLKGWEQGRRQPDATASAYLSVIARLPGEARDALRAA